jgi:hypothetical protein
MREAQDIIRRNMSRIYWANGLTAWEGIRRCWFNSYPGDIISRGRLEKMRECFGAEYEDLVSDDCLERMYGDYQFPLNINVLLALTGTPKKAFARDVGITESEYGRYQRYERKPSADLVKKCEEYFGVPAAKLLFGSIRIEFDMAERDGGNEFKTRTGSD